MHYVILDHYLMNFTKGQIVAKETLEMAIDPDVIPKLVENKQIRKATAAEVKAGYVVIEEPNPQADTLTDTSGEMYQDYREAQSLKLPAEGEGVAESSDTDGGPFAGDTDKPAASESSDTEVVTSTSTATKPKKAGSAK